MKRAAPWFAALFLFASCHTMGPDRPLSVSDPRVVAALAELSQSHATRVAMRGRARFSLDSPDLRFSRPQRVMVARPTSLRVEVLGLFGQVAAILATRDGRYQFFDSAKGVMEEGDVAQDLLWRLARVDLTPEEATGVLLGAPQPAPGLVVKAALLSWDGSLTVSLGSEGKSFTEQRLVFDGLGRLLTVKRFGDDGEALWSVHFADYRGLGNDFFAFRIELKFHRVDAHAKIAFRKVELNPQLEADLFVLKSPAATP